MEVIGRIPTPYPEKILMPAKYMVEGRKVHFYRPEHTRYASAGSDELYAPSPPFGPAASSPRRRSGSPSPGPPSPGDDDVPPYGNNHFDYYGYDSDGAY